MTKAYCVVSGQGFEIYTLCSCLYGMSDDTHIPTTYIQFYNLGQPNLRSGHDIRHDTQACRDDNDSNLDHVFFWMWSYSLLEVSVFPQCFLEWWVIGSWFRNLAGMLVAWKVEGSNPSCHRCAPERGT